MVFSTYDNSVEIDNGQTINNPIKIELSTVCTGRYTDFIITIPKNAEVSRGKRRLKNNGKPYLLRVFENK